MKMRIGQGWDLHRLVAGRRLILGGIVIPFERGLDGHSDADVLTHALIDALLGAIADGDIGTHFPDADANWKDAVSTDLLGQTCRRLHAQGWEIGNVDLTLIAEAPKIAPFRDQIRKNLARILEIPVGALSLKAKTAEGLGPEGAGEAISAQAIVLLQAAPSS